MRVMALWFPDWPIHAADLAGAPAAVTDNGEVWVANAAARARGVRRGMRLRAAQALVPGLRDAPRDVDRDARVFESIVAGLDDVVSTIEVYRPGLVVVDMRAAAKFHGSEEAAAEKLLDAAACRGVDCYGGIADEVTTAFIAARAEAVVPSGGSQAFLATQPVSVLAAEEALHCDPEVVRKFVDLGVRTLGELAALPSTAITTRFGIAGARCHAIARADPGRKVSSAVPMPELAVTMVPEDPISRVDAAAFAARHLAARLHERLARAGLTCVRLKVTAVMVGGETVERVWHTREELNEDTTADRVRWQLDGWLTARTTQAEVGGIIEFTLTPLECHPPDSAGLWNSGNAKKQQARRAAMRLQSTLGTDKVLVPVASGGRSPVECVELVPFGEQRAPARPVEGPWLGQIPAPYPARRGGGENHPASRLQIVDKQGTGVEIDGEAQLTGEPFALAWGEKRYEVTAWAGPWPVDGRWWEGDGAGRARMQVVGREVRTNRQHAWLIVWSHGRWSIEAVYG